MPKVLTERVARAESFIISENVESRSRASITVASGADLLAGTVLGKLAASEKYVALDPDATTGEETAAAILAHDVDASAGDKPGAALDKDCEVDDALLAWPDGITEDDKQAAKNALEERGIKVRGYVEGGEPEAPDYVGPLDLVPGAVVAYSLRALSAAWLGQDVCRLRRDSDDAELNFACDAVTGEFPTAAAVAWRDAVGAAVAFVVTLYDQSGNAHDVIGTVVEFVSDQPQFSSAGIGGKPSITFSPGAYLMSSGSVAILPATVFAVAHITDASAFCGSNFAAQAGDGKAWSVAQSSSPNYTTSCTMVEGANTNGRASFGTAARLNIDAIYEYAWEPTAGEIRINGTDLGATSEGTDVIASVNHPLVIGGNDTADNGGSPLSGNGSEFLIYETVKSSGDRTLIRDNESTFY